MSIRKRQVQRSKLDVIQHLDAVWRTASWITTNESDAEKLTEDVFIEAHRNRGISSGSIDTRKQLFQILIKTGSRNSDWNKAVDLSGNIENESPPVQHEELSRIKIIPQEFITGAIRSLPLEIRIVMVLSTIEQFSYSEIAQIIGCSVEAVSRMKYLSCIMIRKQLSGYNEASLNEVISS